MSTFEFDDVIAIAKVIVSPEQSAAELVHLRAALDEARKILERLLEATPGKELWTPATMWLEKYPKLPDCNP